MRNTSHGVADERGGGERGLVGVGESLDEAETRAVALHGRCLRPVGDFSVVVPQLDGGEGCDGNDSDVTLSKEGRAFRRGRDRWALPQRYGVLRAKRRNSERQGREARRCEEECAHHCESGIVTEADCADATPETNSIVTASVAAMVRGALTADDGMITTWNEKRE